MSTNSSNTNLTNKQRSKLVSSSIAIAFLFLFTQFLLITAFPQIMLDFDVNATQVQWLTTAFLITITIIIPSMGYFMNRYNSRSLTLTALIFFITGVIVALVAQNFLTLVAARIVQAVGAGIMLPLLQNILLTVYPKEKRGYAMGLMTMVVNFAPAVGPPISGIIIDLYNWRFLFWLVLPLSVFFLILNFKYMLNVTKQTPSQLDKFSLGLCAISFSSIILGLSNISVYGLLHFNTIGPLIIGFGFFMFFIQKQLESKFPLLNVRLLAYPTFVYGLTISFVISALLLSTETLLPLLIQDVLGRSAFISGIIMFPGTILLALSSYIAGKIYDKSGENILFLVGFVFMSLSLLLLMLIGSTNSIYILSMIFCLFMIGIGLTMTPATAVTMSVLEQEQLADGTAILNTVKQFSSAIGVTVLTTFASIYANHSNYTYVEGTSIGLKLSFFIMTLLAILSLCLSLLYFRHYKLDRS